MIHTYRVPDSLQSGRARFFGSGFILLLVISLLVFLALSALGSATWDDAKGLGPLLVFFGVFWGLGLLDNRRHLCREIRLSDDGTCELETERRVVRLHVNEIHSVDYSRDSESGSESYTIRYEGGKLRVTDQLAEFGDFLARLQRLNPGVRLTGFPADAWPRLDIATTPLSRRLHAAVFPLIGVAFLILVARQTLLSR